MRIVEQITAEIVEYVRGIDPDFAKNKTWYAGITSNPERRKSEHEREKGINCEHFNPWNCCDEDNATEVEKKLKSKGFAIYAKDLVHAKEAGRFHRLASETESQKYVYVYKAVKN